LRGFKLAQVQNSCFELSRSYAKLLTIPLAYTVLLTVLKNEAFIKNI